MQEAVMDTATTAETESATAKIIQILVNKVKELHAIPLLILKNRNAGIVNPASLNR